MGYVHFTAEQKQRANNVDLKDFLERQGEPLIRSGPEWRLKNDHSITIRGNRWFDHGSGEKGGLAIDFVRYYYGKSFVEAVSMLLGGEQGVGYSQSSPKEECPKVPFSLPPANSDMRRVFAYLLKTRLLERDVVTDFAKAGLLYESLETSKDGRCQFHNAIFVGRDKEGIARHAHKKGIYTSGSNYRGNLESSDPKYSFHWIGTTDRLYVFEAPIDMLSYISLNKWQWQQHSYVALCGVSSQAIYQILSDAPIIRTIHLCLDHDIPGVKAAMRIRDKLREDGYSEVQIELSERKDWNEDLKWLYGKESIPAEELKGMQIEFTIESQIPL